MTSANASVYSVTSQKCRIGPLRAGLFRVRGVASLDTETRYFTEDGQPLLNAAQFAEVYGIKPRTVYQWRRRGFIQRRGLDDRGRELYGVAEVAEVHATPRRRPKCEAVAA